MITINSFKWLCTILFTIGTLSAFSQGTPCDPNNVVVPSIVLSTPATMICAGTPVTFTTAVTNQGSAPTYVWKKNSQVIPGETSSAYVTSTTANGDSYTVEMTSNAACASPSTVVSNAVVINVQTNVVAGVTIQSDKNSICSGDLVTFTATPANGGIAPTYEWIVNAVSQGAPSGISTFSISTLKDGDKVSVKMFGNSGCANPKDATSVPIEMVVNSTVTPSVSLSQAQTVCAGKQMEVQLLSQSGGGGNPSFVWYVNGVVQQGQQGNSLVYVFKDGDKVIVDMSSSASCANPKKASSNTLAFTVKPVPNPVISNGNKIVCAPDTFSCANAIPVGSTLSWYSTEDISKILSQANKFLIPSLGTYYVIENNGTCQTRSRPVTVNLNCIIAINDYPNSPTTLTNNAIIDTTLKYTRGRNSSSLCQTSADASNSIDAFYSFVASNITENIELTVVNPSWLSTLELLDTLTFAPISNTCQDNIGTGQATRTYNLTNLTVGQKYLLRLELGDVAPLGHARMSAVNNTFSVKLNSGVAAITNDYQNSNKTISTIYNLQGVEIDKNYKGLVIYKFTDGTTQKVIQE